MKTTCGRSAFFPRAAFLAGAFADGADSFAGCARAAAEGTPSSSSLVTRSISKSLPPPSLPSPLFACHCGKDMSEWGQLPTFSVQSAPSLGGAAACQ